MISTFQNIAPNYTILLQKFSPALKLLRNIYTFIIISEFTTKYS